MLWSTTNERPRMRPIDQRGARQPCSIPGPLILMILLLLLQETRSSRSRDTSRLSTTRHQDSDSETHLWSVMTKIFPEMMTEITHPQPHGFLTAQPSFRNRFPQFLFIKYRNSQYRLWEWAEAEDYQLFTNYSVFPGIDWWCPWPQPIRAEPWWSVITAYSLVLTAIVSTWDYPGMWWLLWHVGWTSQRPAQPLTEPVRG